MKRRRQRLLQAEILTVNSPGVAPSTVFSGSTSAGIRRGPRRGRAVCVSRPDTGLLIRAV